MGGSSSSDWDAFLRRQLERRPGSRILSLAGRKALYYNDDEGSSSDDNYNHHWVIGDGGTVLLATYTVPKQWAKTRHGAREMETVLRILGSVTFLTRQGSQREKGAYPAENC